MIDKKIFGARLVAARQAKGLTQKALADILGVTRPVIAQYENGFRLPQLEHAALLVAHLDVSLDFLCGFIDEPHR